MIIEHVGKPDGYRSAAAFNLTHRQARSKSSVGVKASPRRPLPSG